MFGHFSIDKPICYSTLLHRFKWSEFSNCLKVKANSRFLFFIPPYYSPDACILSGFSYDDNGLVNYPIVSFSPNLWSKAWIFRKAKIGHSVIPIF